MAGSDPTAYEDMLKAMTQRESGVSAPLSVSEKEYLKKQELSNSKPSTYGLGATSGVSNTGDMTDENLSKLLQEPKKESGGESSSTKDKKEKEELQGITSDSESISLCSTHYTQRIFGNDLIVRKICDFLGVPGIKQFRSVCWDWKNATDVIFRAKVGIYIASFPQKLVLIECGNNVEHEENEDGETVRKVPADMNAFTAVRFIDSIPWKTDVLCEFFNFNSGLGRFITDLRLDRPKFVDEGGNELKEYNISPMISPSIRKLFIRTFPRHCRHPSISLSMDKLSSVGLLELIDCKLIYCGEKLAMKEIFLNNVVFVVNGKEEEEITVNTYIDLKSVKKLAVFGDMYKVDMSEKEIVLDEFRINSTENMVNQENCQWTINTAMFGLEDSVKNLKIKNLIACVLEVDISFLPETLEKLYCSHFQCLINTSATPVNLHKLEYMELICRLRAVLNADLIPKSVSEIKIRRRLNPTGERTNSVLETLTLSHFTVNGLIEFLGGVQKILKPKHIITSRMDFNFNVAENPDAVDKLVRFIKSNPDQLMTIGKFQWDLQKLKNVEESSLSEIVDEMAEFYVFENCRGIACTTPKSDKGAILEKLVSQVFFDYRSLK